MRSRSSERLKSGACCSLSVFACLRFFQLLLIVTFVAALSLSTTCPALAASPDTHTYTYKVVDPLVGASLTDINTAFWQFTGTTAPYGICRPSLFSIDSNGVLLTSNHSYIGPALWAVKGDFRFTIYSEGVLDLRGGVGIAEYSSLDPEILENYYGNDGGGTPSTFGTYVNSSVIAHGGNGYFLYTKEGNTITIRQGDNTGVSDESPVVATGSVMDANNFFVIGAGLGCPNVTYRNDGYLRLRDFVLEAGDLVPFHNTTLTEPPSEWRVPAPVVNDPPVCDRAKVYPAVLWPPKHKMVPVIISGVTDPNDDRTAIKVIRVTQDEPVDGLGDGDTGPDGALKGERVLLRAERAGKGNGRVYHIDFSADDGHGGECRGSVEVSVPHSKGQRNIAKDDGQLYDSF